MTHDPALYEVHKAYGKHVPGGQLGHCHLYDHRYHNYVTLHMRCCASCGAFFGFYEAGHYTNKKSEWQPLSDYLAQDEGRIREAILSLRNRRIYAIYEQYKLAVAKGLYKAKAV